MSNEIRAIDAVVNLWTAEAQAHRPASFRAFFVDKMGVDSGIYGGFSLEEMLRRMDAARTERAFLVLLCFKNQAIICASSTNLSRRR